jgi:hypothetical protein
MFTIVATISLLIGPLIITILIIRVVLEALPCSNTGEQGRHEETSDGDLGGGGDPDGAGGGVLASSGRGLPSTEGERSHLMPLLSSIGG